MLYQGPVQSETGLRAVPVGVSRLAWFRVFASDKSGAVSIEFVILVASLMGMGTLSAVTVQSGMLVHAGVIGDGLNAATELARGTVLPLDLPEITAGGVTNLPSSGAESAGSNGNSGGGGETIVVAGGGGGGISAGSGSGGGTDECPALSDPELAGLECDEQAAEVEL